MFSGISTNTVRKDWFIKGLMINRREFIKKTSAGLLSLSLAGCLEAPKGNFMSILEITRMYPDFF